MIFKPNADVLPSVKSSTDSMNGHGVKVTSNHPGPVDMPCSNVHGGGSNRGYGFATDPTGEVDYPRPNTGLPGLPGINGENTGSLGTFDTEDY